MLLSHQKRHELLSPEGKITRGAPPGGLWYGYIEPISELYPADVSGLFFVTSDVATPQWALDRVKCAREATAMPIQRLSDAAAKLSQDTENTELMEAFEKAKKEVDNAEKRLKDVQQKYSFSGKKSFGVYDSLEDFFGNIVGLDAEKRWCYELIRENTPCALYFDIEWLSCEAAQEVGDSKVLMCVNALRDFCKNGQGRDPEVYVSRGSRMTDTKLFKHSYHLVVANYVFKSNTKNADGEMYQFICDLVQTFPDAWKMPPDARPKKGRVLEETVIDHNVYTKNRSFRLPLNSKVGESVPLVRVSGDPFAADFCLTASFAAEDLE